MPPDPLEVLASSARVGQIRVRPLQTSKPVRLCVSLPIFWDKNLSFAKFFCSAPLEIESQLRVCYI